MAPEQDDLARRIAGHFIRNAPYYEDKAFHHPETTLDEAAETVRIMLAPLLADDRKLREMLWQGHGHDGIYGDDGEMQCSLCGLDYKRDSVSRIHEVRTLNALRAARRGRA